MSEREKVLMIERSMNESQTGNLDALLEEFVRERRYVPEGARVIERINELPLCLQARAPDADAETRWRAWHDGHRIWFIVAQLDQVPGARAEQIALQMSFYDHDAVLVATGVWLRANTGHWTLHSVLNGEPSAQHLQFATAS
ncbi:hypothetical protein [Povalibacter sp.]|uniref:hypothetical protein n=1 Tax=Povalibacter sp. TaxID=1962978 RepID=UPI002F41AF98